jgi:hypothetical protein
MAAMKLDIPDEDLPGLSALLSTIPPISTRRAGVTDAASHPDPQSASFLRTFAQKVNRPIYPAFGSPNVFGRRFVR